MNKVKESVDTLLHQGLVHVPPDFRDKLMQKLASDERQRYAALNNAEPESAVSIWHWIAVVPGCAVGVVQLMRFVFSMWFVTTAG